MNLRVLFALIAMLALFVVSIGSAFASTTSSTISGKLWVNVPYNYASSATPSTLNNLPTTPDLTFDAPSPIKFGYDSNGNIIANATGLTETVSTWLNSGGASNEVVNTAVDPSTTLMSQCGPGTGSIAEFTGVVSVVHNETFTVAHDDGLTLTIGGTTVIDKPGGTPPTTTTGSYAGPTGIFTFQLVYGEVRCGPAVLNVDLPLANPTITLSPPSATNPINTNHTVTANVTDNNGDPVSGALVDFSVDSGPNAGASGTCSANANCTTDSSGNVSFTYTGGSTAGVDTIRACVDLTQTCTTVSKEWVTPPTASCLETVNPSGNNVPTAPAEGGQAQNQDGFYQVTASDAADPSPQIYVMDSGSGTVFGPFPIGTNIKYTQAPGATPAQQSIGGPHSAVAWHIIGTGDANVYAIDASGIQSDPVPCLVPPPPK